MLWYLVKYDPLFILALSCLGLAARSNSRTKLLFVAILIMFVAYFAGLSVIYAVSMGEYEGMRLLSFRRYVELLSVPIQCIIVLQLIQIGWLQRFRMVNRLSEAWKRVGQVNRTRTGGMAFALGISLCLISFFRPLFAQKSDSLLEASIRAVNVLPNLESNKKQVMVGGDYY
jgi:hypothetical protein